MDRILRSRQIPACRLAEEEFQRLYEAVTGIRPESIESDDGGDLILIGGESVNSKTAELVLSGKIAASRLRFGSDDYAIRSECEGGRRLLVLHGGTSRALLYAVYDLFERRGGCGWFWDGDRIPHRETIDFDHLNVVESPRFQYRGLRYFAHRSLHRFQAEHWDFDDWKREIDWIVKKRLNFFMLRTGLDDLFQRAFPDAVPYPEEEGEEKGFLRSYDDRRNFEPLRARGELRRKVLQYAFERGLLHPEDTGTITHWYSRTPQSYLDVKKPKFLNQPSGNYREPTGKVWDIREDENLDAYFRLTATHIREYGSPRLFHTIGLAERDYSADLSENHRLKLYAYDRIVTRLRRDRPDASLWIGSWDFVNNWHDPALIRDLVSRLDPANTVLFDYTSDSQKELTIPGGKKSLQPNDFTQWDVVGRFPWIFGIFHAFESGSEPRGNYRVIAERLPVAAADPFCKGVCFWPETSHTDTLMLEFFAANAWRPDRPEIRDFLPEFCCKRYAEGRRAVFESLWQTMLPVISAVYWRFDFFHADLSCRILTTPELIDLTPERLEKNRERLAEVEPVLPEIRRTFELLAELDFDALDEFEFRDAMDFGRTALHRLFLCRMTAFALRLEAWRDGSADAKELERESAALTELLELEARLLAAHEDYSLNASLDLLKRRDGYNPAFEETLKGNAENDYCRTQIYELVRACYQPELAAYLDFVRRKIDGGDRAPWRTPDEFNISAGMIRDAFYSTPLEHFRPDAAAAKRELAGRFARLAGLCC